METTVGWLAAVRDTDELAAVPPQPVTVTNSAYNTYAAPSKTPSENGQYSSALYVLDAAFSYVF